MRIEILTEIEKGDTDRDNDLDKDRDGFRERHRPRLGRQQSITNMNRLGGNSVTNTFWTCFGITFV